MQRSVLSFCATVASLCMWGAPDAKAARYPLSPSTVATSLRQMGLAVQPSQVQLPMPLSASVAVPELTLISSEQVSPHHLRVRLRCRNAGECVAFTALVDVDSDAVLVRALVAQGQEKPTSLAHLPLASSSSESQSIAPPVQATGVPRDLVLHAGARLRLSIQDGQMLIAIPAIAIDSGAPGTDVRVCTPDRKKIFHAVVMDAQSAKGDLE